MKGLLDHHKALLEASAIAPEVAEERGYFSATEKKELEALGFRAPQQNVPALVIPIRDVSGNVVLHQIRPDRPRTTEAGRELKYETPVGARLALDVHPRTRAKLGDPKTPLLITEGSRKVDSAVSRDLGCIGVLGVDGWRGKNESGGKVALADFDSIALNERTVYIAYDSDVMQKNAVSMACARLRRFLKQKGANVRLVYLPDADDGSKIGLDDFFAMGRTVEDFFSCVEPPKTSEDEPEKKKETKAEAEANELVKLVMDMIKPFAPDEGTELLFHNANLETFVTVNLQGVYQTWPVRSRQFKAYLAGRFYEQKKRTPSPETLQRALLVLEGRAIFEGPTLEVHTRLATGRDGALYLDLADSDWKAVRIDSAGWNVVPRPPVRFRRAGGMLPLPRPKRGGDLGKLRQFVNVASGEDFALLVGWLVGAVRDAGPYLVLVLQGEQGSAKSTTSRVLRSLIDPNKAALRSQPKEPRDLAIAARNAWTVALDNLSGVTDWLSDGLCRLATGGGFATRALYTDDDEAIFDSTRPVLLNGIDSVATRGDLLDRSILLSLPRLKNVTTEREFFEDFEKTKPELLGALLDAVSTALRRERETELEQRVRMADAARWVVAAEPALPWPEGHFLSAYAGNREDANDLALEANPVAAELIRFMKTKFSFAGTSTELLAALEEAADEAEAKKLQKLKAWPRSGRGLSGALRRLAPNLRAAGLDVDFDREPHSRRRLVLVEWNTEDGTDRSDRPHRSERRDSADFAGDGHGDGWDSGPERPSPDRPRASSRKGSTSTDGDGGDGPPAPSADSEEPPPPADEDAPADLDPDDAPWGGPEEEADLEETLL